MERVTTKILNISIERFNKMECLKGNEIFISKYENMPRLFLQNKKLKTSFFIFEGTKAQCCTFLLSLSAFLISNSLTEK